MSFQGQEVGLPHATARHPPLEGESQPIRPNKSCFSVCDLVAPVLSLSLDDSHTHSTLSETPMRKLFLLLVPSVVLAQAQPTPPTVKPGWRWSMDTVRTVVNAVRAGRSLQP